MEAPKLDTSQFNPIFQGLTFQNVPLMQVKMEQTSIQDFKVQEESENVSKAKFDQEHKFLDALVTYLVDEEVKMVLARMIRQANEESNERERNRELKEPQTKLNVGN